MEEFLSGLDLHDMSFIGPRFTWSNNKSGNSKIWVRHDRIYFNTHALHLFPLAQIHHLLRLALDHCSVLLRPVNQVQHKPFRWIRFEDTWLSFPNSWKMVHKLWKSRDPKTQPDIHLRNNCSRTLRGLFYWSKDTIAKLNASKTLLEDEIYKLQILEGTTIGLSLVQEADLRIKVAKLDSTLARISSWWRQRAKVRWARDGDTNSHFFHSVASARRRSNLLSNIQTEDGFSTDPDRITSMILNFYRQKWLASTTSFDE